MDRDQSRQAQYRSSHYDRTTIEPKRQSIDKLVQISGSKWLYDAQPLQIIFRDAVAAATHRSSNWELVSLTYCTSLGLGRK